jgi:hypothetical protein
LRRCDDAQASHSPRRLRRPAAFWTIGWQAQGQNIEEFKYFKRWFDELGARPAVLRGLAVTAGPPEDVDSLPEEEKERPPSSAIRRKTLVVDLTSESRSGSKGYGPNAFPGSLRPRAKQKFPRTRDDA